MSWWVSEWTTGLTKVNGQLVSWSVGQWSPLSGQWSMESGQWSVVHGEWSVVGSVGARLPSSAT